VGSRSTRYEKSFVGGVRSYSPLIMYSLLAKFGQNMDDLLKKNKVNRNNK